MKFNLLATTISLIGLNLSIIPHGLAFSVFQGSRTPSNLTSSYKDWLNSTPDVLVLTDNLNGLSFIAGNTRLTTSLGSRFTADRSTLSISGYISPQIPSGAGGPATLPYLTCSRSNSLCNFKWTLPTPSKAFSVFTTDNDGGKISLTLNFNDSSSQVVDFTSASGEAITEFFGISGLSKPVSSVIFSTTDPGGVSSWDNFAYAVPEPLTILGIGTAVAFGGFFKRRSKLQK